MVKRKGIGQGKLNLFSESPSRVQPDIWQSPWSFAFVGSSSSKDAPHVGLAVNHTAILGKLWRSHNIVREDRYWDRVVRHSLGYCGGYGRSYSDLAFPYGDVIIFELLACNSVLGNLSLRLLFALRPQCTR